MKKMKSKYISAVGIFIAVTVIVAAFFVIAIKQKQIADEKYKKAVLELEREKANLIQAEAKKNKVIEVSEEDRKRIAKAEEENKIIEEGYKHFAERYGTEEDATNAAQSIIREYLKDAKLVRFPSLGRRVRFNENTNDWIVKTKVETQDFYGRLVEFRSTICVRYMHLSKYYTKTHAVLHSWTVYNEGVEFEDNLQEFRAALGNQEGVITKQYAKELQPIIDKYFPDSTDVDQ